ncbi:hypothetical protein [Thiomicrorhabdus sp. Milos-T2]|uniref:hypothetical protein n=1 Tax=Thiomicrorhabdus sp. Milos-T2 TaxID=90814 RepID=UPI000493F893|nr:hypothetical protein [Thiomicrorhabdus sp. Milos-T2]
MNTSNYYVEFDGSDYIVLFGTNVVAAFANSDEAYSAKRSFEERPVIQQQDRTPPAMKVAKALYYSQLNAQLA